VPSASPSHILVLNKFPVIANHFILATKANKPQTHALEEIDLAATYACLKAWEDTGADRGRLFAFFNSGDHSGASQPHRHLQFLPIDSMRNGEQSKGWNVLVDSILSDGASGNHAAMIASNTRLSIAIDASSDVIQHPALPFTHFAYRFETEPSEAELSQIYNRLYQLAKQAVDSFISSSPDQLTLHDASEGNLPISYNLAMTTVGMAIVPRRSEGYQLRRDDGSEIGFVQLNGTLLGGTFMVKFQEEWDVLQQEPTKLDAVLEAIGIPKTPTNKL